MTETTVGICRNGANYPMSAGFTVVVRRRSPYLRCRVLAFDSCESQFLAQVPVRVVRRRVGRNLGEC